MKFVLPAVKRRDATLAPSALIRGLKPTATFIKSLRDPTAVRLWEFRDETPHFAAAPLAPPSLWIVLAGLTHGVNPAILGAVGLPTPHAAEIDLAVLRIDAPAHESRAELEREFHHGRLRDTLDFLLHDVEQRAAAVAHKQEMVLE